MAKIVVGDTNAVIQLAIISMAFFKITPDLEIVIHSKAIEELRGILGNADANEEIKPYLKTLLDVVKADTTYKPPSSHEYERKDAAMRAIEEAMEGPKSAPTDRNDRLFLIIASHYDLFLCTREGSLFTLARNVLKDGKAWGVCDVIEYAVTMGVLKQAEVQEGITRLLATGETLHSRCRTNLKDMGYRLS
jgi:hypothetical protein